MFYIITESILKYNIILVWNTNIIAAFMFIQELLLGDCSKAKKQLKWAPKYDIQVGHS